MKRSKMTAFEHGFKDAETKLKEVQRKNAGALNPLDYEGDFRTEAVKPKDVAKGVTTFNKLADYNRGARAAIDHFFSQPGTAYIP